MIRHDVDRLSANSLRFAIIESELDIMGSYYFRVSPRRLKPFIIDEIAKLGHEIGYHYEDLSNAKGDPEIATGLFEKNLKKLRQYYPVKTICMHGSPLSRYDNRDLWKYINYRDYGIIGEPYFDINFEKLFSSNSP